MGGNHGGGFVLRKASPLFFSSLINEWDEGWETGRWWGVGGSTNTWHPIKHLMTCLQSLCLFLYLKIRKRKMSLRQELHSSFGGGWKLFIYLKKKLENDNALITLDSIKLKRVVYTHSVCVLLSRSCTQWIFVVIKPKGNGKTQSSAFKRKHLSGWLYLANTAVITQPKIVFDKLNLL